MVLSCGCRGWLVLVTSFLRSLTELHNLFEKDIVITTNFGEPCHVTKNKGIVFVLHFATFKINVNNAKRQGHQSTHW